MLAATRADPFKASAKLQEEAVTKSHRLIEKFSKYSNPNIGITKPMNVLEMFEKTADGKGYRDPWAVTKAAQLMENFERHQLASLAGAGGSLVETSRASLPAWIKNGLALIAAAQSEDLSDRVISHQVMPNRNARIHFLDIVSEKEKGNVPDRAQLISALNGWRGTEKFSSEEVEKESIGAAGGTDYTPTLGYGPVIPGTVLLTDGSQEIRDDRNGNLIGDVGAPGGGITNTIDYLTRTVSVRFAGATGGPVRANYRYNIEAALSIPEYGISLSSRQVEARPRALSTSWTQQAVMDFMADYGIDVEPTVIEAGARLIQLERFKHIVNTLRSNATGGSLVFDNTAPAGVSYRDHLKTFGIYLSRLQDQVWEATQVARPNILVIHPSILFAVAFQDGYEGQKFANDGISGPRFVGRLTKHDIDVFADPTFFRDSGVLTYRGPEFVSTAAVLADYVQLYKSPVHVRAFRKDMALLSEYAIEVVNGNMIATLTVVSL